MVLVVEMERCRRRACTAALRVPAPERMDSIFAEDPARRTGGFMGAAAPAGAKASAAAPEAAAAAAARASTPVHSTGVSAPALCAWYEAAVPGAEATPDAAKEKGRRAAEAAPKSVARTGDRLRKGERKRVAQRREHGNQRAART